MNQDVLTIRTVDAVDVHLERAGIGSRAYAFLIDWHIRALAALAWFLVAIYVVGLSFKEGLTTLSYGATIPAALIYFLYHPVLEIAMQGQTPGKRWIHLRIVTADGGTPGFGALLMRNVFRLLDSLPAFYALGLLAMFCTRDQVRVGDLAAGTLVVYESPPQDGRLDQAVVHAGAPARIAPLLEEWLVRWNEIDPAQRDDIARALLRKVTAGDTDRGLDSIALRERVRSWLNDTSTAG